MLSTLLLKTENVVMDLSSSLKSLKSTIAGSKNFASLKSLKSTNADSHDIEVDQDTSIDIVDRTFHKHFSSNFKACFSLSTFSEKLEDALSDIGTPMSEEELRYLKTKAFGSEVNFCEGSFQQFARLAHKLHFLSNLVKESSIHVALEEFFPETVEKIFELDEAGFLEILTNANFLSKVAKSMFSSMHKRTKACAKIARSLNSKFISEGGDFLEFGGDSEFHGGLEQMIGLPDPSVMKAIIAEHLRPEIRNKPFITPNYLICTTPEIELAFLFGREEDITFMHTIAKKMKNSPTDEENPNGPTDEELKALEIELNQLQEINQKILASGTGKYPGEIGDFYIETEVTLDVEFQKECKQHQTTLSRALVDILRRNSNHSGSLRVVPQEAELRLATMKATSSKVWPELTSLVLPIREQDLTTTWREELVSVVEETWGLSKGRVHIVDVRERTWRYIEEADHAPFVRQGRKRMGLQELLKCPDARAAELRVEEVIVVNEYTGPMYLEFNGILRAAKQLRRQYTTSLHCLVSAVTKLSRCTVLPRQRKLWRGLGSRVLSESSFFDRNDRGTKGGVERGFLSTSSKMDVAMQYSGYSVHRGTVLELDYGKVDCPARLDSLSQYPGEGEMLFGPLSYLEAVGCSRLEPYEGSTVLVVPVRINCNLRAQTIEETIAKRKRSQVAMVESLIEEIKFDFGKLPPEVVQDNKDANRVNLKEDSECSVTSTADSCSSKPKSYVSECCLTSESCSLNPTTDLVNGEIIDSVLKTAINTMSGLLAEAKEKPENWFNQDDNYRKELNKALDTKNKIVSCWWLRSFLKEDKPKEKLVGLLSTYDKLYSMSSIAKQAKVEAQHLGAYDVSIDEVDDEGLTPLISNSRKGTLQNVRLLLLAGADTRKEKLGKTALHVAAEYCQLKVAESLIAMKADANMDCRQIVPILKYAETRVLLRECHPHVLDVCRRQTSKCDHCNSWSKETRVFRCEACHYTLCMACFRRSKGQFLQELKLLGVDGWTRLMIATADNDKNELRRLLESNESSMMLDVVNILGKTAAHLAAERDDLESVKLLCDAGADVNIEDRSGQSVCDMMKGSCAQDMRTGRGWTPLMLAVDSGDADEVSQLLAARAHLEARNASGRSALHVAARRGQLDVLKLLMDARANVDSRDSKDKSVLSMARGSELCRALRMAGADGWTAQSIAEERAHSEKLLTCDVDLLGGRLPRKGYLGLYFGGRSYQSCLRFHPKLVHVYKHLNTQEKVFEVVYVSSDRNKEEFLEFQATMPWLAVPYDEGAVRVQLEARYNAESRAPALAMLDAETGEVVCDNARESLAADPQGKGFPWRPLSLDEQLGTSFLVQQKAWEGGLEGKYVGLLFAGRWCPACQRALPFLLDAYEAVRATRDDFEIVFCSSDQDQAMFDEFVKTMPWMAIPYADRERKQTLSKRFEVTGIPTLMLLTPARDACSVRILPDLAEAPFPWPGKPFGVEEDQEGPPGCPVQ